MHADWWVIIHHAMQKKKKGKDLVVARHDMHLDQGDGSRGHHVGVLGRAHAVGKGEVLHDVVAAGADDEEGPIGDGPHLRLVLGEQLQLPLDRHGRLQQIKQIDPQFRY
jgi:hypothetical protein